jgi:hypothetical protein
VSTVIDEGNVAPCIQRSGSTAPTLSVDRPHASGTAAPIQLRLVRDLGEATRKGQQRGQENHRGANSVLTTSHD